MSDVGGSCQNGEQVPKHEKRISPQQNLGSVPAHSELAAAGQTWLFSFLSRDLGPLLEMKNKQKGKVKRWSLAQEGESQSSPL